MAATTTKRVPTSGWYTCSNCGERIAPGSFALRSGSRWTHPTPCSAPAHAPVVGSSAPFDPVLARALAPHLSAGRLPTCGGPEPLSAWEREYENEG